jgi:hypothetical protein
MAQENLFEVVDRLQGIVDELRKLLYGDDNTRVVGIVKEFDLLRRDVAALHDEVERLKRRRPNIWLWVLGFLMFSAGVTFGMVGLFNLDGGHIFDLPATVALWLAGVLTMMSLLLFLGGFGWLDRA